MRDQIHVQMNGIAKRYEGSSFELRIPELVIRRGERIGLVGNNGAGKTTLLHVLLGSTRLQSGSVTIDGDPVERGGDWKFATASYFGEASLIPFLTPEEYWNFVGEAYGLDRLEIRRRLARYTSFVDLEENPRMRARKYIRDYSQGNRKKIGLIASLLVEPDLLVLDEPSANLDPRSHAQLTHILLEMNRELGTTVLVSSHDLLHVVDICARILIVDDGRIAHDAATSPKTLGFLRSYLAGTAPEDNAAPASTYLRA